MLLEWRIWFLKKWGIIVTTETKNHSLRAVSVLSGDTEDYSLGDSLSASSEELLQSGGVWGRSACTASALQIFTLWIFKDGNMCTINVRLEWNCSLPSISHCWQSFSSTVSHLFSLLQSGTLLACWLDAIPYMPALILCFPKYCTVRVKMFSLFFVFSMYYLCENYCTSTTVQYYIAGCYSWVPRQTVGLMNKLDLWTHSQNGTHSCEGNYYMWFWRWGLCIQTHISVESCC